MSQNFPFLGKSREICTLKTREKTRKRKIWNLENKRSERDSQDDETSRMTAVLQTHHKE